MASSEGDQLLAGTFHAIIDQIEANKIYLKLQRSGIGNESSCIKHTFSARFQLWMPVLHQSMCTFTSKLVFEVWAKYKDVPTKRLKCDVTTNPSQQNLKICDWTVQTN